jgi:tellurite resistance protein
MIRGLETKTLVRLRDHLLQSGGRKSLFVAGAEAHEHAHPLDGDEEAKAFFDAVAETMYLMVATDGKVEEAERVVIKGAIRELTANQMRTPAIDALVAEMDARVTSEGQAKRLASVCELLSERPEAAEAAFVLAAAVAFADNEIADEENELLNDLAEKLDISGERAEQLLDELEADQNAAEALPFVAVAVDVHGAVRLDARDVVRVAIHHDRSGHGDASNDVRVALHHQVALDDRGPRAGALDGVAVALDHQRTVLSPGGQGDLSAVPLDARRAARPVGRRGLVGVAHRGRRERRFTGGER